MSSGVEVEPAGQLRLERIRPADWGVEEDCFVRLQDPGSLAVVLQKRAPAGSEVSWLHTGSTERLLLTLRRVSVSGKPASAIGPAHGWVPSDQRGAYPEQVVERDGLAASVRDEVIFKPHRAATLGAGLLRTKGYVGAWASGEPVPEVMDFALGRQYYSFFPEEVSAHRVDQQVIYAGRPQDTWGHFLTQGLARIWYALSAPDVPLLWDAHGLDPFHREVLALLDVRNEHRFLHESTRFSRALVPFPGSSIGDFVHPAFTRAMGRVPTHAPVPGRRLFLSRSGLGSRISLQERRLDALAERHGFEVFRPERHDVREQLAALSSAEIVLGVEGSAFHSVLLLQDPVRTRFFALSRHRGGSGVFEHIRTAKQLRYATLNFLSPPRLVGHDAALHFDLDALDVALRQTQGLSSNLEALGDRVERPWPGQTSFEHLLLQVQVRRDRVGDAVARAHIALSESQAHLAEGLAGVL